MKNNKVSIPFLLQKARINKQVKCPIRCRITFLDDRHEFSTGLLINPNTWYSKLQQTKPPNEENSVINNQLSLIKNKINQAFLFLQMRGADFDVTDLYFIYKGEKPKKEKGLTKYFTLPIYIINNLNGSCSRCRIYNSNMIHKNALVQQI